MERVSFITVETGDDLIVSFAVQCQDDPAEIESLILVRTPKYEFIIEEHERGVRVSFERFEDDEDDYLRRIDYAEADALVRIQTTLREFELEVRKVDTNDLKKMRQILKKMNYDQKFQTSGL